MEQTTNNNIKIVRLQSGEDVMANYYEDTENGTVLLDNPMHIIFKRIPTGQTVMMMMPWLPIELIKQNNAIIYDSDILTIIDPKEDLIEYYGNVVLHANERMENTTDFFSSEDDEDDEDDEYEEKTEGKKMELDEVMKLLEEKKKAKLH
jgi:hypothetical protein